MLDPWTLGHLAGGALAWRVPLPWVVAGSFAWEALEAWSVALGYPLGDLSPANSAVDVLANLAGWAALRMQAEQAHEAGGEAGEGEPLD